MNYTPRCPICGAHDNAPHAVAYDIEYCTSEQPFEFRNCAHCDILFIAPMLSDRLADIYPTNYYSFSGDGGGLVSRVKEFLDRRLFRSVLYQLTNNNIAALDVGGGTGWLLNQLKATDSRVQQTCVVDIDSNARAAAIAAGHSFFLGRIEEFNTADRFDLILMLNIIEHVPDPSATLNHVRTLMSPSGRVIIKTPNFDALDARIFRHRSWAGYHTPRHFVLFKKDSILRLVNHCGFEVKSFSYTQGAPFWSASLLNELRRLGLVHITQKRPAIYHPLAPLMNGVFAAFDFARLPFAKLSRMQLILSPRPRIR
jgi:2-polyprenyl-3-methyl-5-hydroxy-6-metoxy-1,4-benzoquinol methylase